MDKVAVNYYSVAPIASSSHQPMSVASLERSPAVRGHHSGVNKAVEAHRMMVEERQTRKVRRDRGMEPFEAQQPADLVIADTVTQSNGGVGAESRDYEANLIEPIESEAKLAAVQAFQSQEPDRPFIGEPVPKGSYLDVAA